MSYLMVLGGLVLLLAAGDALVKGAVSLSLRLGIPALVVSLTIVAFGTSAPELLIAVEAALGGSPAIAIGNVVGSNIANVLIVLGIPAIVRGFNLKFLDCRRTYLQMIGASLLFTVLCFAGPLALWHGVALLVLLGAMLADAYGHTRRARVANIDNVTEEALSELAHADPAMPVPRVLGLVLFGVVGLPLGADLFVDGAIQIAQTFQVPEEVIGLTLVAVGTSLPELATTVMAAIRRQPDVAFGNVIGSNLFNILAIMGIASLFGPLPVPAMFLRLDLWVMIAVAAALVPFVYFRWELSRLWGVAFVAAYMVYLLVIF